MMPKPKNGINTGGRSSSANSSRPTSLENPTVPDAMKLRSQGNLDRVKVALLVGIGNADQHLARRLLCLPARFDRREFGRLVVVDVVAVEVAEDHLRPDQHCDQARPERIMIRDCSIALPRRSSQAPAAAMHMRWSDRRRSALAERIQATWLNAIAAQTAGTKRPSISS